MNRRQLLAMMAAPIALTAAGTLLFGKSPVAAALAADSSMILPVANNPGIKLGAYDPYGNFADDAGVKIEHLFLPWQDVDLSSLSGADRYAQERGRSLLITVEPWTWAGDWKFTPGQLKTAVLAGRYDSTIAAIATVIGSLKSQVTIRWGQEMDDTSGRFSWGGWAADDYIAAYRRFRDITRSMAPGAKFMWSPKGNANLADYYPGDDNVDVIGLSIFGLQKYDRDKFGHDRTFADHLQPAYDYASRFNKPIIVAELGYSGDKAYVWNWANSVTRQDPRFPLLVAVVYFNDKEVHPWPETYGLPDWRVAKSVTS